MHSFDKVVGKLMHELHVTFNDLADCSHQETCTKTNVNTLLEPYSKRFVQEYVAGCLKQPHSKICSLKGNK